MARKAINGYPEKSYYDNTVFGGIVATSDPLNEGSFGLLTNFDITDSGKSMVPRKGYTTTTFTVDGAPVVLSDKVLMYRDPNIQKDIILDLNKIVDNESKFGYLTDITQYSLTNNLLSEGSLITGYEFSRLTSFVLREVPSERILSSSLKTVFQYSSLLDNFQLRPIRDRDGVTYYVTKLHFDNGSEKFSWWLKVLYRPNQTTVGGVTYTGDTLVFDAIDTTEQTTALLNRNIASRKSIIPDPLRVQEVVGIDSEDTKPSEVNRPILLKFGNNYATQNIPETYKTSLDIKVEPTFYLQDPARVIGGVHPKWAYRFDFIRTNNNGSTDTYKTPWRELVQAYTMSGNGTNNPIIDRLKIESGNSLDEVYTYYLISDSAHSWHSNLTATAHLTGLEKAEEAMYSKMQSNGVSGSSGSDLGNLAFAYLKHETVVNTFKPLSLTLDDIEPSLYTQMNFRFLSEDDVRAGVSLAGNNLDTLLERTAALSQANVDALTPSIYPSATTSTVSAPIIPMTYAHYNSITKMTLAQFVVHAKEKQKTKRIKIVFVPFIYHYAGAVSSVPFSMIYLCSIGGIYVNGLKANLALATGDIADYNSVTGVKKTFTFESSHKENYIDVFGDLGNLNINQTLAYLPRNVYDKGIFLVLYLKPYNASMLSDYVDLTTQELVIINKSWDESAYKQTSVGVWAQERDVVYIDEYDEENPEAIESSVNNIIFEDRLVVWQGNKVYISEEGDYHYFTNNLKKIFPEEILKVISFKTILLVFTTQNLYAIYRAEIDTFAGTYNSEGTPEFVKEVVWLQQPVLYNINPDRKYLDVIQVYNQMILFYSNEGQLYMIKPSTMIDSETQFAIQYFNKSANNILANYHDYINERLKIYNKIDLANPDSYVTKDQVIIKALVDIDLIKIFYIVPDRIVFVLIYDVVNNRYTTYDTLSFNTIDHVRHVEGGELYVTKHSNNTYFTLPTIGINNVDQNVDKHYARMFKKDPVFALIDTGNLNLNNHLNKRMRDLRVVIKNLDATKILYNAEVLLDDSVSRPFYGPDFKVRMVNGPDSMMTVDKVPIEDVNELFGLNQELGVAGDRTDIHSYYLHEDRAFFENNALLKTETLNSSRLIEYNSSILGLGKVIRLRLQFIAKGKYKLQSFGIVYKERRI